MADEQITFDAPSSLSVGARGVPGQRTFYVIVGQGTRWVRVWLEKQALQNLGNAITQLLESLPAAEEAGQSPIAQSDAPPGEPMAEFHATQLALANDEKRNRLVMITQGQEQDRARNFNVQVWAERSQMRAFSQQIEEVCAAGRPICPLCGQPIDPESHACVRSNGYHS